jgi:hypothetical protein
MIKRLNLPDKIFSVDSRILLLWLQPVALALVIIFSLLVVILPKIEEISEKIKEIKTVSQKIVEVNQKRSYLQTVDQEETLNNAKKLADALLPERNSYLLVRIIRDAAAQNSYNVDDFSISMGDVKNEEVKNDNNYDRIPVSITLIGPSDNYIALVKTIERALPIMSIDNFEMRSQNGVATIRLNVLAYYLRDISSLKIENLTLGDLTPSQEEAILLSTISEYRTMSVESTINNEEGSFVKYERQDPFFTL